MFSVRQKREIAEAVQKVLRATNHPELPMGEIAFQLHVDGAEPWSWADIQNNAAVSQPSANPWNEKQDRKAATPDSGPQSVANKLAEWINAQPVVKDENGDPTIAPVYAGWVLLCEFIQREEKD